MRKPIRLNTWFLQACLFFAACAQSPLGPANQTPAALNTLTPGQRHSDNSWCLIVAEPRYLLDHDSHPALIDSDLDYGMVSIFDRPSQVLFVSNECKLTELPQPAALRAVFETKLTANNIVPAKQESSCPEGSRPLLIETFLTALDCAGNNRRWAAQLPVFIYVFGNSDAAVKLRYIVRMTDLQSGVLQGSYAVGAGYRERLTKHHFPFIYFNFAWREHGSIASTAIRGIEQAAVELISKLELESRRE